jgi:hypothetical protein
MEIKTTPDTVLASKVVIGAMSRPLRIVMRKLEAQYVIHNEVLNLECIDGKPEFTHSHFDTGDYFPLHYEGDAIRCFNDRASKL